MARSARAAIVGLGFSPLSRKPIGSTVELALRAVTAALDDAVLPPTAVDGLLVSQSELAPRNALSIRLRDALGLGDLALAAAIEAKGTSALQMVQQAVMAIDAGLAKTVVCVFSDTPVGEDRSAGQSYARPSAISGIEGWEEQYGLFGAVGAYGLAARRYMTMFGITERHLGAYAIACRQWAAGNPLALMQAPLDIDGYLQSPFVAEPLRVLDCALPVNGAAAVIVTSRERGVAARNAAFVHGIGQGHNAISALTADAEHRTGGCSAVQRAMEMAGIGLSDITMCQLYDAFSFSALFALEDIGLCRHGEAGGFVAGGQTGPSGSLPVNTGGGQLSSYYLQGMTPLSEAVVQGRGLGGRRQAARNDIILVNGSGGCLEFFAAMIVSPHETL
ncbi:MAG: thiolase family protein [Xanthobacteraceae bacterium]|nr:thiolase family protein [Xanthobacteraceae bacterium]